MKDQDTKYYGEAVAIAAQSFEQGNYPVGAVLTIDGKLVGAKGNTGISSKSYINHAETSLVIEHAKLLFSSSSKGQKIELISTLEPCLMCLGVAVMNKVDRIVYLQSDPHGGACRLDPSSLGVRYSEIWPEIIYDKEYSSQPKQLILRFLQNQIDSGSSVEWSKRMIELFTNS